MNTAHFVEEKITAAVRRAEHNGDTVLIARQVKEALQVSPPSSDESLSSLQPTNQVEVEV